MANQQFTGVSCGDAFTEAASIHEVFTSSGGVFQVEDNPASYILEWGPRGGTQSTPEATIGTGGGSIPAGVSGIRFRNATPGLISRVSALIRPRDQPHLALAFGATPSNGVISGIVDGTGAKVAGSGFSSSRVGVGQYLITFNIPFISYSAIAALPNAVSLTTTLDGSNNTAAQVSFRNAGGALVDALFCFIVAGA